LRKEYEQLLKKGRSIQNALNQAQQEIQQFHTQKQQKLNEMDVWIPLRPSQVEYIQNSCVPNDLSPALVFVTKGLESLRGRITELQQEKLDIRKRHKELKRNHISLVRYRREKQSKQAELDQRLYEVQMLKFGRIIDLEKLEKLGVNKTADELREKLVKEEYRNARELEAFEVPLLVDVRVIDCSRKSLISSKTSAIFSDSIRNFWSDWHRRSLPDAPSNTTSTLHPTQWFVFMSEKYLETDV
jgi:hypothetical protein